MYVPEGSIALWTRSGRLHVRCDDASFEARAAAAGGVWDGTAWHFDDEHVGDALDLVEDTLHRSPAAAS